MKSTVFALACFLVGGLFHEVFGKAIVDHESSHLGKVYQTGEASGFAHSIANTHAFMLASGSPAGILNTGGTTATFSGSSVVSQNQPSNTSTSVGGALNANCGGGQLSTYIAGQTAVGINSVGNCDSIIISSLLNNTRKG